MLPETAEVVTVNVAVVDPAATVTVPGTVALVLNEASEIEVPPVGATPLRVTVPVDELPPRTELGAKLKLTIVAGFTVSVADFVPAPRVAVIDADAELTTAVVEIVNVALVAPAGTVTDPGTEALALPDDNETTAPPAGAGPLSVTVPVEEFPPITDVGARFKLLSPAAFTVSEAD